MVLAPAESVNLAVARMAIVPLVFQPSSPLVILLLAQFVVEDTPFVLEGTQFAVEGTLVRVVGLEVASVLSVLLEPPPEPVGIVLWVRWLRELASARVEIVLWAARLQELASERVGIVSSLD